MLFSLIAIVVAAFAVVALIVSQMKTREEMSAVRAEMKRISAQATDAAQQLKVAHEALATEKKAPAAAPAVPAPVVESKLAPRLRLSSRHRRQPSRCSPRRNSPRKFSW